MRVPVRAGVRARGGVKRGGSGTGGEGEGHGIGEEGCCQGRSGLGGNGDHQIRLTGGDHQTQ